MPYDPNKPHFVVVAHCIFEGGTIHHWMHKLPADLPPTSYNFAATVMDKTGGRYVARACVILRCDMPADHPQMKQYIGTVMRGVEKIGSLLVKPAHSLLLVAFKMSDLQALPDETDCLQIFTRQNVEHSFQGSA